MKTNYYCLHINDSIAMVVLSTVCVTLPQSTKLYQAYWIWFKTLQHNTYYCEQNNHWCAIKIIHLKHQWFTVICSSFDSYMDSAWYASLRILRRQEEILQEFLRNTSFFVFLSVRVYCKEKFWKFPFALKLEKEPTKDNSNSSTWVSVVAYSAYFFAR